MKYLITLCLFCSCATPQLLTFRSHLGVSIYGDTGTWITPQMTKTMDEDLVNRLGPRWGNGSVIECLADTKITVVDKLPNEAGSHIDWEDGGRSKIKQIILAKRRKCALDPGAKGATYIWAIAHAVLTCMQVEDTDESGSLWEGIAQTGWSCP